MLSGIKRIFYVSHAQKSSLITQQKSVASRLFWEKTTLSSIGPSRPSFFCTHRGVLINNLNKLKIALCLFGFGVFSATKAVFVVCPLICVITRFLNNTINRSAR
jgi:hypothetical protein